MGEALSAFVRFGEEHQNQKSGAATIEQNVPVGAAYGIKLYHDLKMALPMWNNTRIGAGRLAIMRHQNGVLGATNLMGIWELWAAFAREAGISENAVLAARPTWDIGNLNPTLPDPGASPPGTAEHVSDFLRTWAAAQMVHKGAHLFNGVLRLPVKQDDGAVSYIEYPLGLTPFVEFTYRISTFPAHYGLGKTIRTITLLPGEEQEIQLRTWQSTKTTSSDTSSLFDSYEESTKTTFQSALEQENQETVAGEDSLNWNVSAEVSASFFGMASAKVSGGASGETKNATSNAVRAVSKALNEHAAQANRSRKIEVSTTDERETTAGEEFSSTRKIKNTNLRRTLNFVFRELNQVYQTIIHLVEIRVGLRSALPDDFVVVDLRDARGIYVPSLPDGITTPTNWSPLPIDLVDADRVVHNIVREVGATFDEKDELVAVLESQGPPSWVPDTHDVAFYQSLSEAGPKTPIQDLVSGSNVFWRFRRNVDPDAETVDNRDAINQDTRIIKVAGLVVSRDETTMKTSSLVVEALLGSQDALDDFAMRMQDATVREKELLNDKLDLGINAVKEAADVVQAYATVFGQPTQTDN